MARNEVRIATSEPASMSASTPTPTVPNPTGKYPPSTERAAMGRYQTSDAVNVSVTYTERRAGHIPASRGRTRVLPSPTWLAPTLRYVPCLACPVRHRVETRTRRPLPSPPPQVPPPDRTRNIHNRGGCLCLQRPPETSGDHCGAFQPEIEPGRSYRCLSYFQVKRAGSVPTRWGSLWGGRRGPGRGVGGRRPFRLLAPDGGRRPVTRTRRSPVRSFSRGRRPRLSV